MGTRLFLLGMLGGCVLLSACAPKQADATVADARDGALSAPSGVLDANVLGVQTSRAFEMEAEDGKSTLVVRRDAPPDCFCAGRNWKERHYVVEADPPSAAGAAVMVDAGGMKPVREQTFTIIAGSGLGMLGELNYKENVEVVFDPPLIVLPHGLPGFTENRAEFSQEVATTVHPMGDRSRVRNKGTARNTIRYVGDQEILFGADKVLAKKITTTFVADLGAAKVTREGETWFAPGLGVVMERSREKTTALGVPIRNNVEEWRGTRYGK